jgi:hypothetical protein
MAFKKLCYMAWTGTILPSIHKNQSKIKILFLIMKQQIYNFLSHLF